MAEPTTARSSGSGSILSRLPWWGWGLILGGGVLAYVLYTRSKSSSSSSTASTATPSTSSQSATSAQELQTLEEQLLAQQSATAATPAASAVSGIAGTGSTDTTSTPTEAPGYSMAPYTGEQQLGLGFAPAAGNYGFIDTLGNAYEWVTNPAQAQAAQAAGLTLYYQPTPGVAAPVTSALDGGGPTPQYIKVPQGASAVGNQAPSTLASGYPSNL